MHICVGLALLLAQGSASKGWIWTEPRSELVASPPPSRFGHRVVSPGDVDGDGTPDLAVSDPAAFSGAGAVFVVSGVDGRLLKRMQGSAADRGLGTKLEVCADFDQDGIPDLLVGAEGDGLRIVSSRTGRVLDERRGRTSAVAVDLDGDGVPDLISSGLAILHAGEESEVVQHVLVAESGCDDHELFRVTGPVLPGDLDMDAPGMSMCVVGDLDGDGVSDIAAYLPRWAECKRRTTAIRFLSGRSGVELRTVKIANEPDESPSSTSLALAGDVDGDGILDLLAPDGERGAGLVISGRTGSVLLRLQSARHPTTSITRAAIGDIDGDGVVDFAVAGGSYRPDGTNAFGVEVFSGKTGSSIGSFDSGEQPVVVSDGRDFDGDGIPDLPVGLPEQGEVMILSGKSLTAHPPPGVVDRGDWPEILEIKGTQYVPALPSRP
jgi:hypothetical protein